MMQPGGRKIKLGGMLIKDMTKRDTLTSAVKFMGLDLPDNEVPSRGSVHNPR